MPEGRNLCQDTLEYAIQNDAKNVKILRLIFSRFKTLLKTRGFGVFRVLFFDSVFCNEKPTAFLNAVGNQITQNHKRIMNTTPAFC